MLNRRFLGILLVAISLAGCGGGGSIDNSSDSNNGDSGSDSIDKMELMLVTDCPAEWDANRDQVEIDPILAGCKEVSSLSSNTIADVFIKLSKAKTGDAIDNTLVNAQTTLGTILPSSGTAITDAFGIALLKLQPGNQGGAGSITVTAPNLTGVSESVSFAVGVAQVNATIDNGLVDAAGTQQSLAAGGSTVITVTLTDQQGQRINSALEVGFSSNCAAEELAELDATVNSSNGIAKSTYRAKGCQGEDRITVTIQNGSQLLNAETTIFVDSAQAQALQFLPEADGFREFIALPPGEGGLPTQSVVSFKLVDEDNLAVARARVDFKLSDDQGSAVLTQSSANTNAEGIVRTTVKSGVVPGPLVVSACYIPEEQLQALPQGDGLTCWTELAQQCNAGSDDERCPTGVMQLIPLHEQIFSVSSQLVLSSGVTDQDTFDASPETTNINAYSYNGVTNNITVYFGDQFNHFNANGVSATVIAEAGVIGSLDSENTYDCKTEKATCTVVWRSQGERPFPASKWKNQLNSTPDGQTSPNCDLYFGKPAPCINGIRRKKNGLPNSVVMGGRVSVLAFVKGQETFRDEQSSNGVTRRNGLFDIGEFRQEFDLSEAFLDTNENQKFDKVDCDVSELTGPCSPSGTENGGHDDWWMDANNNGFFDKADGRYNGLLCSQAALNAGECTRELINVYKQFEIIMSDDTAHVRFAINKVAALASNLTGTVDGSLTSAQKAAIQSCSNVTHSVTITEDGGQSQTVVRTILGLEASDTAGYCDVGSVHLMNKDAEIPLQIYVSDINGNPLPAGTEVAISTSNGELPDGAVSSIVESTNSDKPHIYAVRIKGEVEPNNSNSGALTISFTYPSFGEGDGKVQSIPLNINDAG
ncbi:hypothetical protein ACSLBF_06520 [Pseudoalteromonas sp. T1lg65]|uniref:hypothetical protein n=1 Tax=Pseudoalteromonas sp. T1lg65 TaxID=2077101 RepID=UPI003F79157E